MYACIFWLLLYSLIWQRACNLPYLLERLLLFEAFGTLKISHCSMTMIEILSKGPWTILSLSLSLIWLWMKHYNSKKQRYRINWYSKLVAFDIEDNLAPSKIIAKRKTVEKKNKWFASIFTPKQIINIS